ncbi:MAG: tol-pal system protein YbgF [Candidatus Muproteobacteria bacterium RBG_16_65_34]|uniref:Cell division coordinator CpoB n=1 Tax=Candidatus Muproteobacteria bacterium RBG_16_65_34 TaxID=1817760 RepID=A0A1F6TVD7_9PROT|nr:MAG: tol-pal system protein YbgF [Candidatus Muproteobacteria bacterium RBG_16_65_34]
MVEMMLQLEAMQTEQRRLRGELEVQTHELDKLKTRERELIADIDRRLRELEQRTGAAPAPAASAEPAPARAGTPKTAPAASASEQQQYDAAFNLMKQGLYERSVKAFREFIGARPQSALAGNAQYWIGEAYYVLRDFKQAIEEFTKVLNDYSDSAKVPDALLKIGYTQYELGAHDKAREALNQVIARYPNTTVAKSAEQRLAKMKKEGR